MAECLFQQFHAVFLGRQDAKVFALRVDELARIDDHADKMGAFAFAGVVMLQPDPDTGSCIPRAYIMTALFILIDPVLSAFLLFCIQLLFALFPFGFAELHRY